MTSAAAVIAALELSPHPEGGWYRETLRAAAGADGRSLVTAIYFLLEAGQESRWHRVDAIEIWCWHAGHAVKLRSVATAGPVEMITLGGDILAGEQCRSVVPAGDWQAAAAGDGWGLVSCIVAPGFDFAGFELAAPGWQPD